MKKIVLLAFVSLLLSTELILHSVDLPQLQVAYGSPYTNIDVHTAYIMITGGSYPDLVVLDVRYKDEYDSGHIYGAVWIPVSELDARIGELAGHENHEIIVYCKAGSRSPTAASILDSHGFTRVYNMLGGISAWQSAGYPVWIATVHNVDTAFNYDFIQAAIYAAQTLDEHTIFVDAGTYHENVVVNKEVSIVGENRSTTIIDPDCVGKVIEVAASNVTITGFTIQKSGVIYPNCGVYISEWSTCSNISDNIITNNYHGIVLNSSGANTISGNNITNNIVGMYFNESSDNKFFHNNFIDNSLPVYDFSWDNQYVPPSVNTWDNDLEGNYWSDYSGIDECWGPHQNLTGSDGISDAPYSIDENNQDKYPLMSPYEYWSNPIPGDINKDKKVDSEDLSQLATAYGSTPEKQNWNPNSDLNPNNIVDVSDLYALSKTYGETKP